jgi:hypothetical protein
MPMTLSGTTGIVLPTAAAPAFSAFQSSAQTLSGSTLTKINFQTEEFDTNSNYDTTNMRFTPTVAGYYQVSGGISLATSITSVSIQIYKNGTAHKTIFAVNTSAASGFGSCLVFLNGSSDYIELYGLAVTGQALSTGAAITYFQAVMVRSTS